MARAIRQGIDHEIGEGYCCAMATRHPAQVRDGASRGCVMYSCKVYRMRLDDAADL